MRSCNTRNDSGPNNEQGIAMLTVLLVMMMMTALGIAALTATGLENRMAGSMSSIEGATAAAESCTGIGVNIIQQTLDPAGGAGTVPASFLTSAVPAGPVAPTGQGTLSTEIMGGSDNNTDTPEGAPNFQLSVGSYTVYGDIDRLYLKPPAGSGMQQFAGYEGTGNSSVGTAQAYYRVDCVARNPTTGTSARVAAVYACTSSGESCQK
ncbi:MAG: hypothetical protein OEV01_04500 [Nitrospira sp.]|nr:hypothetical protein [Nitrospira sp.]MDH4302818.1 hypothetical protein [Nitrospira sp.]MDH5192294.1 hypothetical protein [Nitrospira sp.]